MALREKIRNFILESRDDLLDDESILEKGIMDSTGVLELVAFLESTYEVKIEDEELILENLDTINNIVSYLERKLELDSEPEEA